MADSHPAENEKEVIILKSLFVPEHLKEELRKPLGRVYSSIDKIVIPPDKKLITVGDRISYSAIMSGLNPNIIVYDRKEDRVGVDKEVVDMLDKCNYLQLTANNPPGHITEELQQTIKKSVKMKLKIKIFVMGEEDLAVIPFILESDENTVILYGQPKKGIVFVEVNENIKNKCRELLNKMEVEGL